MTTITLPTGCSTRPASEGDQQAIADLFIAHEHHFYGDSHLSALVLIGDINAAWSTDGIDLKSDSLPISGSRWPGCWLRHDLSSSRRATNDHCLPHHPSQLSWPWPGCFSERVGAATRSANHRHTAPGKARRAPVLDQKYRSCGPLGSLSATSSRARASERPIRPALKLSLPMTTSTTTSPLRNGAAGILDWKALIHRSPSWRPITTRSSV